MIRLTLFISMLLIGHLQEPSPHVTYYGSLRGLMQHDLSGKISLDSLKNTENLYALGAISELKGEILVLDSRPYLSSVEDGNILLSNSWNVEACLLVKTLVKSWEPQPLPDSVLSHATLEKHLHQFYHDAPLPFLLKGKVKSLKWHVIDWDSEDTIHSHAKHKKAGLHGEELDQEVIILGFYSDQHYGEFTHHSTNLHMHFVRKDDSVSGHIDDLVLTGSVTLETAR